MSEEEKKKEITVSTIIDTNVVVVINCLAIMVVIAVANWLSPDTIHWKFWELWDMHGTGLSDWLRVGVPLFLWAAVTNAFFAWQKKDEIPDEDKPTLVEAIGAGFIVSVLAGVMEEISHRWIYYLGCFVSAAIINFLLFGIPEWLYMHLIGPIVDFTTFGFLKDLINK